MSSLPSRFFAGIFDLFLLCAYIVAWTKYSHVWYFFLLIIPPWMELCWQLKGTPGKVLFNIGIAYRGRGHVYLREFLGKGITWATAGLGLIPILFARRRALHDFIANTDVIPWPRSKTIVDGLRLAAVAIVVAVIVSGLAGSNSASPPAAATPAAPAAPWKVANSMNAVMTIHMFRGNEEESQGSGFLIGADGTAITNVHVLRDGDIARVELGDGRQFIVTSVIASNLSKDIALFKIGPVAAGANPTPFPIVKLGSQKDIDVGDKVIIVGSPEGLENTVSEGILSARRPKTDDDEASLQVSAPISPGSSGGPVFDSAGGVIGVSQSTLEEGQNLNFAIPIEAVQELLHSPALNLTQKAYFQRMKNEPDPDAENASTPTHPASPAKPSPSEPADPPNNSHTNHSGVTATISRN